MPHKMFLNKHRMTKDEILELIGIQTGQLSAWFGRITFPKLGDLVVVDDGTHAMRLSDFKSTIASSSGFLDQTLGMEGCFFTNHSVSAAKPGKVYFCGIERRNTSTSLWVLGTMEFNERLACVSLDFTLCPMEEVIQHCSPRMIFQGIRKLTADMEFNLKSRANEFSETARPIYPDCDLAVNEMLWK